MNQSICSKKYYLRLFFVYRINIIFAHKFKINQMKKLIVSVVSLLLVMSILTSCGSSRKTGCPMNEGIIH